MLRKALITTAVLALCAITALVLWSMRGASGETEQAEERAPVEHRLKALEKRLARISRQSHEPRMALPLPPAAMAQEEVSSVSLQPRVGPVSDPEPETAVERRALRHQQVAQAIASEKRHFEQIYRKFAAEPVDGAWADRVKTSLSKSFGGSELAKLGAVAIDCRTSYCAVDLGFASGKGAGPASQRELVSWLDGQDCGFHVPGFVTPDSEPMERQRIYIDCSRRRVN